MDNQTTDYVYVFGDGDSIRMHVEKYLFEGNIKALMELSSNLAEAINELKNFAISDMDAVVIIAGGDDLLLQVKKSNYHKSRAQKLIEHFKNKTGCTMSMGIGATIDTAYLNLRRAKTFSDRKIVEEVGL
jgi:GTP cyclohydrolase III